LKIDVSQTKSPRPRPDAKGLGFGRVFTDHMFVMEFTEERGWHDARVVPYAPLPLEPGAAVLHYAQAVFEGLKAFRTRSGRLALFRPDRNCQRMVDGAARLCMPELDPAQLLEAILALVRVDGDWTPSEPGTALYIRPTLIASEPFLGVRPANRYTFFIILSPVGAYYPEGINPVKIWVERRYVRAAHGGLGDAKAGANYAASLLAAREAQARGYSQVLWLDAKEHRYCEEMGVMNLFVRIGEEVVTPPLEGTILPGITRDAVLTLLSDWGTPASERQLTVEELVEAHRGGRLAEVFGCGTAAVISPVGELGIDGERLVVNQGRIGALAQRLYDAITDIQYGAAPDPHGWMLELPE
jgi:branched-chain amino acid aminotransferase